MVRSGRTLAGSTVFPNVPAAALRLARALRIHPHPEVTPMSKKEISALYTEPADADRAYRGLIAAGFVPSDISVLMSETTRGKHFSGENFAIEGNTKAAEGAATGGVIGGTIGAIAAGLVAVGALAIPGVGLLAAGPLVAALAGAGAGAAVGGLTGGLIGLGFPEHEAKLYSERIAKGAILVGVRAEGTMVDRALGVFKQTQGTSIRS
jgi:hypothetical protein